MTLVYLALGTNLGDKIANLSQALDLIAGKIGFFSAVSSIYETEPWGFQSENNFLNMLVVVETSLPPLSILQETQTIEKIIGRTQKTIHAYRDRLIDIDLIAYNDLNFKSENLELPHPLFHRRRFVLEPFNEIAPDFIHPVLQKTVKELFEEMC